MAKPDFVNGLVYALVFFLATLIQPSRQELKVCEALPYNTTQKIQCICKVGYVEGVEVPKGVDCWIADRNISPDDKQWDAFKHFDTYESVKFSVKGSGKLTFVPTKVIKSMPNLLSVTIKLGSIQTIEPYAFANLSSLEELILSGNEIEHLKPNAFTNHPRLLNITLDRNKITEIKRNVFHRLHFLQKLYMTSNNISIIHDHAFEHLQSLIELELNRNSIFVLTKSTFSGLKNLMRLELKYNQLEVIGENTFSHLHNLRELSLGNNKIEVVDHYAFNGLTKLSTLYLANNKIRHLDSSKIFAPLQSILYLNIRDNQLRNLTKEVMAPIFDNFLTKGSKFEFAGNNFTCDCNLNWFEDLKNKTNNSHLAEVIDSMTCHPRPDLVEDYKQYADEMRQEDGVQEEEEFPEEDSQPNGELYFFDIPMDMLPCGENQIKSKSKHYKTVNEKVETVPKKNTVNYIDTPQVNHKLKTDVTVANKITQPVTVKTTIETIKTTNTIEDTPLVNLKGFERNKDLPVKITTEKYETNIKIFENGYTEEMNDGESLKPEKKVYSPSHISEEPSQYNKPSKIIKHSTEFTPIDNPKSLNSLSIKTSPINSLIFLSLLSFIRFR